MKRFNFLILSISVLMLTGFCGWPAHAENTQTIHIDTLKVQILPEYDDESTLVIWGIELSDNTDLPRELMMKIPAKAEIQSIALINQEGDQRYVDIEGEAITIGDWQNIRVTTTSPEILVKYLDPNLIIEENQRKYAFNWVSTYAVKTLSTTVYQPTGSNDMIIAPPLHTVSDDSTSIRQYSGQFGAISANEHFSVMLRYTNEVNNLSYPLLDVVPANPIDEATKGRSSSPWSVILWLLAVAISILVMVGLYFWWAYKNMPEKRPQTYQGVGIINPEKQMVYCHECGMRSQVGDSYCRNCGTPLHQSAYRGQPPQA